MVKPASLPRLIGPLASLAVLLGSTTVSAQQAKPADQTKVQSEEAVFIPIEYRPPPYQVSVGVRFSGKAKVKFSQLGSVPNQYEPLNNITDVAYRGYDNGYVAKDYTVDAEGNPTTKTDGKTNLWSFTSDYQVVADPNPAYPTGKALQFMANRIESRGASAEADNGSSLSWDVEISRELGSNKRFSWGLLFGAAVADVNSKTKGTVKANLRTITDTYSLGGAALTPVLNTDGTVSYTPKSGSGPYSYYLTELVQSKDATTGALLYYTEDSADGLHKKGDPIMVSQYVKDSNNNYVIRWADDSIRLNALPFSRTETLTEGIDIEGTWQVKGAFMTARFGPFFGVRLGERFAARISGGVTVTILGARLLFQERYLHPILNTYLSIDTKSPYNESTVTTAVGYFVSGELDWFLTQRTGIFVGALHESYTRNLRIQIGDQTADIDVSAGTAFRTGITTRF